MNWEEKDWVTEDALYEQKRHVSNKISWRKPHIIGSFYSSKLKRAVEYESLCELLFYHLLEIDKATIRYYVQPVEVKIGTLEESGEIKIWSHVPDVLVFRNGSKPLLYQIKNSLEDVPKNYELINKRAKEYASMRDWIYLVIFPKDIPKHIQYNLRFLSNFVRIREYYNQWIPQIIYRIKCFEETSIAGLALSFKTQTSPFMIIPAIYYLIAIGTLQVNFFEKINVDMQVQIAHEEDEFHSYFISEGVAYNEI